MGGSKPQITLEQYMKIAGHGKEFCFGKRIILVDTTDFASVSYEDIAEHRYSSTRYVNSISIIYNINDLIILF